MDMWWAGTAGTAGTCRLDLASLKLTEMSEAIQVQYLRIDALGDPYQLLQSPLLSPFQTLNDGIRSCALPVQHPVLSTTSES